jgi:hypothetical protein
MRRKPAESPNSALQAGGQIRENWTRALRADCPDNNGIKEWLGVLQSTARIGSRARVGNDELISASFLRRLRPHSCW